MKRQVVRMMLKVARMILKGDYDSGRVKEGCESMSMNMSMSMSKSKSMSMSRIMCERECVWGGRWRMKVELRYKVQEIRRKPSCRFQVP